MMNQAGKREGAESAAAGPSTFAAMYDEHVDEVYRFVHRRCRDHAMAEDITQETFIAAIRVTNDPSSLSIGWLLTVARNRLVDLLRRQSRYEGKLQLVAAARPDGHDAELVERLRVESALNEMSANHRLVLTLHYIDGLTVPALAERLDQSVKSIEGLVTRARRELKARLDGDDDQPGTRGSHE